MDVANQVIAKMAEVNEVEVPDRFLLKQKPHLEAKNEVGMGSLIASSKLRGKQILRKTCKKYYVKLELGRAYALRAIRYIKKSDRTLI